jgi:predicted esterase
VKVFASAMVVLAALSWATMATAQEQAPADAAKPDAAWCAPELETLAGDVCHFTPKKATGGRRTLVVFLHGVIEPGSGAQWMQQRGIVRAAERLGFSVLAPRGRQGIGPPKMRDWHAWPTSHVAQQTVEEDILTEWRRARTEIETRQGQPFDEVFVMGFSNGAYYATSLAVRDRFEADGFAVFAGGSGAPHIRKAGAQVKAASRAPIFVAIAARDSTTSRAARDLVDVLRRLRWPHRAESLPVGHAVADRHMDHAFEFLRHRRSN